MTQYNPAIKTEIDVWAGLNTNVDKNNGSKGETEVQINATIVIAGQLTVRPGMQQVTFEN